MGIKPDHWIRRMAKDHKMIEPFVEGSVRNGVISYGVSSYGYDIRVSNEFKVFTNVNSAVVDPKNFVPQSFIDVRTDVCIIPPNSFALSRTVEYFRIPREVLVICLGKCLTGDTRVVDAATGDYLPIRDFVNRNQTLSLDGRWKPHIANVSAWIPQGVKPVYELITRMGLKVKATANHPFRQLNGWTPLAALKPGDRIAAARVIPLFGETPLPDWEAALLGLMIAEGQCDTPGHSPTFTTSDPALVDLLQRSVAEGLGCEVSHNGATGYRIVNRKGRGGVMAGNGNRASGWLQRHNLNVKAAGKFVPPAVFKAPRQAVRVFLQALFSGDGSIQQYGESVYLEYLSMSRRLIEDVHHLLLRFGITSLIREKRTHLGSMSYRIQITDVEQVKRFAERVGFWLGSQKQQRLDAICKGFQDGRSRQRSNFDILPVEAVPLMHEAAASMGVSMRSAGVEGVSLKQSLSLTQASRIAAVVPESELANLLNDGPLWDVVERIEYVGEEEVFDLTVPGVHNFIANDLFVHNSTYARCGLIVNVTPLEPEWEGYLTLEISNTTPLPARVYANEGIAQLLFLAGDGICEQSYKDKKGKYQGQVGVTLPRIEAESGKSGKKKRKKRK
jgi:deoxycytidine triphosphate deaminase/intein/homing endonuclease